MRERAVASRTREDPYARPLSRHGGRDLRRRLGAAASCRSWPVSCPVPGTLPTTGSTVTPTSGVAPSRGRRSGEGPRR